MTFTLVPKKEVENLRSNQWVKQAERNDYVIFCTDISDLSLNEQLYDSTVLTSNPNPDSPVENVKIDTLENSCENIGKDTVKNSTEQIAQKDTIENSEPITFSFRDYTGSKGCQKPMSHTEYEAFKKSGQAKDFEDTRLKLAKQAISGHCILVDQVLDLMNLFDFEDTRLEFAKFVYNYTYDIGNYFKINDAFEFESSTDALIEFINSQK